MQRCNASIGWADYSWNPVTGCLLGCDYCYARRMANRLKGRFGYPAEDPFQPTLHDGRLGEPASLKKPARIFTCSMGDLFGDGVGRDWPKAVLQRAINCYPQHRFLVLTKRPDRIANLLGGEYTAPKNLWLGVSVTCQTDTWRIRELEKICCNRFVSFEPLHGPIHTDLSGIHWVIVGPETGNRKGRIPMLRSWVECICDLANEKEIPVYLKRGLAGPGRSGAYDRREEFPEELEI